MDKKEELRRAVLVGIVPSAKESEACDRSLGELSRLLETAGGETAATLVQVKEHFDPATCLGSGKVEELRALCEHHDCTLIVFDFELSPSQIRNLEKLTERTVIDRTMLILDIFALHAVTGEGKLQVELAQLRYTAPRLIGKGAELSRQGGGIGSRGPGESRLETDRRHIHRRIDALEASLAEMQKNRATMRTARDRSGLPKVAIVGYTNAGKSTLLNHLTDAGVLSENKLFATLDPTTRRLSLPEGEEVLLTDTVGLIRRLPHHLVKAFHSTLEEAAYADILMIVLDASDAECGEHLTVTEELLAELSASDKPTIYVYNKSDLCEAPVFGVIDPDRPSVAISSADGRGVDALLSLLSETVQNGKTTLSLFFPYDKQASLSGLHKNATVLSTEYTDRGVLVTAVLDRREAGLYRAFFVEPTPPSMEEEE